MSKHAVAECDYPLAKTARVVGNKLNLTLRDGRKFSVPLRWFPGIAAAPASAKRKIQITRPGIGVRWPILGYDLGVGGLVSECLRQHACAR